jgi:hypothetical protein
MSFLDFMRGFLQIAEHEREEETTETAHIIRLIVLPTSEGRR